MLPVFWIFEDTLSKHSNPNRPIDIQIWKKISIDDTKNNVLSFGNITEKLLQNQ